MNYRIKRIKHARIALLLLLFTSSFTLFSQEISDLRLSIKASGKPLHAVLDDLTAQTGYHFTFDSRLTDSRRKVTLTISDITVQEAIDTLFLDKSLTYKVINKNIVVYPANIAASTEGLDLNPNSSLKKLHVEGVIRDVKTGNPLPYATVAVMDTYLGTISNEDGSFQLHLPDSLNRPILITSFLGYKDHYTPVSLLSDKPLDIAMNRSMISLQEVIIRYQDPVSLLSEAIKRINKNYLGKPSGMTAYYREKVQKDDKCMIFSEAVVEIAKAPYSNSMIIERTRLLKGRKISDIGIQDTVVLKIRSGLNTMLQLDIIKNPPDFLQPEFARIYDLHFSDLVSYKDNLVYVISFRQKESVDDLLFRGELYIERESLAIIAADFEYDPLRIQREQEMFVAKKSRGIRVIPVSAQYHVEYNQVGGKHYLSMVQGDVKFKVRKRRQWIASKYQINLDMAVTNVNPENPPDIKISEQLKPSTIMSDEVFQYDPGFWGDYTTISPETELSDALLRIEKSLMEIMVPAKNQ